MSDVDPDLLEALGNLVGLGVSVPQKEPNVQDDEFVRRLEKAERLANGLDPS